MAFAKKCRLKVEEMAKSTWVYGQLRRFRAGIEGCISHFKRALEAAAATGRVGRASSNTCICPWWPTTC